MSTYIDPLLADDTSSAPITDYNPITRDRTGDQVAYRSLLHVNLSTYGSDLVVRGGVDSIPSSISVSVAMAIRCAEDETYHLVCPSERAINLTTGCPSHSIDGREGLVIIESQTAESIRFQGDAGQTYEHWNVEHRTGSTSNRCVLCSSTGQQTVNFHQCRFVGGTSTLHVANASTGSQINFYDPVIQDSSFNTLGVNTAVNGCEVNIYNPTIFENTSGRIFAVQDSTGAGLTLNVWNPVVYPSVRAATDAANAANLIANAGTNSAVNIHGGIVSSHAIINNATGTGTGSITDTSSRDALIVPEDAVVGKVCLLLLDSRLGRASVAEALSSGSDDRVYMNMITDVMDEYPGHHVSWAVDDWFDRGNWGVGSAASVIFRDQVVPDFVGKGHELTFNGAGSDSWSQYNPIAASYSGAGANPRITVTVSSDPDHVWVGTVTLETDSGVDAVIEIGREAGKIQFIGNPMIREDRLYGAIDAVAGWSSNDQGVFWDDTECDLLAPGTYTLDGGLITIPFDTDKKNHREITEVLNIVQNGGVLQDGQVVAGYGIRMQSLCFLPGGSGIESAPSGNDGTALDVALSAGITAAVTTASGMWQTDLTAGIAFDGTLPSTMPVTYSMPINSTAMPNGGSNETDYRSAARIWANFARTSNRGVIIWLPWRPPLSEDRFRWLVDEFVASGCQLCTLQELEEAKGTGSPARSLIQSTRSAAWASGRKYWDGPRPGSATGEPRPDIDIDCGAGQSLTSPFHPSNL